MRLGHYEILEKLGSGGMGEVYKARDSRLERLVAVKVLPANKVADAMRKQRFIQEARAASALNHPNIVTIYDIPEEEGVIFLVMEYVQGKSLETVIPRRGVSVNAALQVRRPDCRRPGCCARRRDCAPRYQAFQYHGHRAGPGEGA